MEIRRVLEGDSESFSDEYEVIINKVRKLADISRDNSTGEWCLLVPGTDDVVYVGSSYKEVDAWTRAHLPEVASYVSESTGRPVPISLSSHWQDENE